MTDATTTQGRPAMPGVTPYLSSSDANAAIAFYQRAFAAEVVDKRPADDGKRLIHCLLMINGGALMMSDCFPEYGYAFKEPQGVTLHLQVDDVRAWWDRAISAGAEETMPLEVQFWGDRYGQLRDPFGVAWSLGGPA